MQSVGKARGYYNVCILWRGAKETAEFCRFWRSSVSATRDWNGGIMAGFL